MIRLALIVAFALAACGEAEPAPQPAPDTSAEPVVASVRVAPRDQGFSVEVPTDLLVQPFDEAVLATTADGAFRLMVERREGALLEILGQLKDELIGLGWEITEERHFESATLLSLAQGPTRARYERSVWLVQAAPHTILCDAQARSHGTRRLGAAHRVLCQSLKLGPPPDQGETP